VVTAYPVDHLTGVAACSHDWAIATITHPGPGQRWLLIRLKY
jgi:hypothetical protein